MGGFRSTTTNHPARRRRLTPRAFIYESLEARRLLAATLVQDLDTRPGNQFRPIQVTESNGVGYFSQHDGVHGAELWRSDGTAGGTRLVKDIFPGPATSLVGFLEHSIVNAAGTLFFAADDGTGGAELWKSDGTEAGTVPVADIRPGAAGAFPAYFVAAGTGVYFFADDGTHGREVWHSDGTPEGTSLVKDLRPGAASQVQRLGAAHSNGSFLFYANNGVTSGLWRTDGTEAGTIYLKGTAERLIGSSTPMVQSGAYVYIADAGGGLWLSDGTPTGTIQVETGNSLTGYVTEMESANGVLYFVRSTNPGTDPSGELWARTPDNSTRVTDVTSALNSGRAGRLTRVNAMLYFSATIPSTGAELWRLPGGGTVATMVRDATPGISGTEPIEITSVGSTVYFTAGNSFRGYSLWRSDGTSAGTTLVTNLNTGTPLEAPADLTAAAGRVLFVNDAAAIGPELWSSAGTAATTGLVVDLYPGTRWSQPFFWGAVGNRMLFNASTPETAIELWASDGTPGAITLLADINPGPTSTNPAPLVVLGDVAYFSAGNAATGREPWLTDGTPQGTRRLIDLRPGAVGSEPFGFARLGDTVYFTADDGVHGYELWKTDGTAAGTVLVKDIIPGATGASPGEMVSFAGKLYFVATAVASGAELWVSDGTEAGTVLLKDIRPGTTGGNPTRMTVAGGALYFAANGGAGVELWKTDGTPAGTAQVKDIRPGTGDSAPSLFTDVDGIAYFVAADATSGAELWKTDGTLDGTLLVKDIRPGSAGGTVNSLVAMNGRLYFTADDGASGRELWTSGGTAASTQRVIDIYPSTSSGVLQGLAVSNGRLFFAADDGTRGNEIWTSDGTAAGTSIVNDLHPGLFPGTRGRPVEAPRGVLYLEGNDGVSGFEPYKIEDTYAPYVVGGAYEGQGRDAVILRFNESVVAPNPDAFQVLDARSGVPVATGTVRVAYDGSGETATFDFPHLPGGRLSSGDYIAVLHASGANDANGNPLTTEFRLPFTAGAPAATVTGRWVFYNGSASDGADLAAGPADDNAIAANKQPLLPGQGPATLGNYTSYSRGINGVMIDIVGLPTDTTPTAMDFDLRLWNGAAFTPAPIPTQIAVRRGAGIGSADRLTLVFADNSLRNTWLNVTVLATARTGLAAADVFSFGNLVGDTGGAGPFMVDAGDAIRTRQHVRRKDAAALDRYDFNRDGSIDAADLVLVRNSQRRGVSLSSPPSIAAVTSTDANLTPAVSDTRRAMRRGQWITGILLTG